MCDRQEWTFCQVWPEPVRLWEPSYDPTLWQREERLHLFYQIVGQGDAETLEEIGPQTVGVLDAQISICAPSSTT